MKQAGLGASPRKLLDELRRISCVDVILPLENQTELRLTRMIHECLLRPAQVASGGVLAPTLILNNS
jgi:hypothetical protein